MSTSTLRLLVAASVLVACDKSLPPQPTTTSAGVGEQGVVGTVRISGSSALQPLVNAAKERFEAERGGVSVEVSAGGSKKGLTDVASGAVHIGASDIPAPPDLAPELVDHKVAVVGFAAMANRGAYNERVTAVAERDLAKVFTGEITNWKELGGEPQPIVVINRAAGSGTRMAFGRAVLGGDRFVESQTEDNSGALVAKLKQTRGAISYLALSFDDPGLRTLSVRRDDGTVVAPTAEAITSGDYPIWSYEHLYTRGAPSGATRAFLDYVLSRRFQDEVVPTVKGFIPVTAMKVERDEG